MACSERLSSEEVDERMKSLVSSYLRGFHPFEWETGVVDCGELLEEKVEKRMQSLVSLSSRKTGN